VSGSEPSDPAGGGAPSGGGQGGPPPRGSGSVTLDPLIGRVLLDRYEVLRRIGSGGMGAVYVGRQPTVGREVALKVLRADLVHNDHVRQRFRREAEIIGRLKHPNTIQLIDYGETPDGLAVMVMELLQGFALNERLKERGPMPVEEVLHLGEQVASSLAEAHVLGLVHRDLKPANIFLTEVAGQVHAKVLDFGIARLLDEEATRLTSTGQVFGTPRYMSPEQAMSTADVDARSDIYSLGLILYECLVGQPPFVAQTSIQYLSAHTTQAPPKLRERLPAAPPPLEELIDACLAKEPEDRPQTAEELVKVLGAIRRALSPEAHTQPIIVPRGRSQVSVLSSPTQAAAADTAISTLRPAPEGVPEEGASRGWVAIVVGGLLGLLVVGGVTFGMFGKDRPAPTPDAGGLAGPVAVLAVDAGQAPEVALPPDAGAAEAPDAGAEADAGAAEAPDAAEGVVVAEAPDAGHRRVHTRTRDKDKTNNQGDPQLGQGAIVGPRGMVIDVGGDDADDPRSLAKRCTQSVFSGLSKLTVKGCPKDCAIIVDSQCAGRTPAVDRAIPPGYRTISVVCDGKIKRTASVRFTADETTEFRCR
jgi:serine/threonine protein kinase